MMTFPSKLPSECNCVRPHRGAYETPFRANKLLLFWMLWWGILPGFFMLTRAQQHHPPHENSERSHVGENKPMYTTSQQRQDFQRDGYIFVPGLLLNLVDRRESINDTEREGRKTTNFVEQLQRAGRQVVELCLAAANDTEAGSQLVFSVLQRGLIIAPPRGQSEEQTDHRLVQLYRQVAIHSQLGPMAAELMQLDPDQQNLRLLKDVFLAKHVQASRECDWHVDDQGFWPESFLSDASAQSGLHQYGMNVWIALDDMPAQYQGSMAVARGSHQAEYRWEAYQALGQDRRQDGGFTEEEVRRFVTAKPFRGTCNLDETDPVLRRRLEQDKVVFDIRAGDVIFASRLLFHRVLPVTEDGVRYYQHQHEQGLSTGQRTDDLHSMLLKRYSIRYVPGTAKLPKGYNLEPSLMLHPEYKGQSLNQVSEVTYDRRDGYNENGNSALSASAPSELWYPQVWPVLEPDVDAKLDHMAKQQFHEAKALAAAAQQEFMASIRAIKESQRQPPQVNHREKLSSNLVHPHKEL